MGSISDAVFNCIYQQGPKARLHFDLFMGSISAVFSIPFINLYRRSQTSERVCVRSCRCVCQARGATKSFAQKGEIVKSTHKRAFRKSAGGCCHTYTGHEQAVKHATWAQRTLARTA